MQLKDLSIAVENAFESLGLPRQLGTLSDSNRPDLSDLQCTGSMQAAKILKQSPNAIAKKIQDTLSSHDAFKTITIDGPGYINFTLSDDFIIKSLVKISFPKTNKPKTIVLDYGGPNVAKPLHVGHLRSAIIGESMKRIARKLGHNVIADIHLGDWGTPMGMLLAKLERDYPEWDYFQPIFKESDTTKNPPFKVDVLNALYPEAAKLYKEDEVFAEEARQATAKLQGGHPGYRAMWKHFLSLSIESIKNDFSALDVDFDLWYGESSADPYIEEMVQSLLASGIAHESNGAIVVDVSKPDDKEEIPPLLLRKRDGAATYATTDLATIFQRVKDFNPDNIMYVVDNRQGLHFKQVFRAAARAGYINEQSLHHLGFGTMNGTDGKPFKTREGGVLRLGELIRGSYDLARKEAGFDKEELSKDTLDMLQKIAVASIKFGDLSNPPTSDYIFDQDTFVRFEGKTGPYIQYATVRAKSILEKFDKKEDLNPDIVTFQMPEERKLALTLLKYQNAVENTFEQKTPNILCDYAYRLSRDFSVFYRNCSIVYEKNENTRALRLSMTDLFAKIAEESLNLLAISVPDKMIRAETPKPISEPALS
jgi:arginyl-tRNA synthetase